MRKKDLAHKARKSNCATCPFRAGGWEDLRPLLTARAVTTSPLCHSSGPDALKKGKGWIKEPQVCRGARDMQLQMFYGLRFIEAPTDEAWEAKWREITEGE